ncbi:MAG: hypothetical protein WA406_06185, partial [Pseudolabrys sp.]
EVTSSARQGVANGIWLGRAEPSRSDGLKLEVISADAVGAAFAFHALAVAPRITNQKRRSDFAHAQLRRDVS